MGQKGACMPIYGLICRFEFFGCFWTENICGLKTQPKSWPTRCQLISWHHAPSSLRQRKSVTDKTCPQFKSVWERDRKLIKSKIYYFAVLIKKSILNDSVLRRKVSTPNLFLNQPKKTIIILQRIKWLPDRPVKQTNYEFKLWVHMSIYSSECQFFNFINLLYHGCW